MKKIITIAIFIALSVVASAQYNSLILDSGNPNYVISRMVREVNSTYAASFFYDNLSNSYYLTVVPIGQTMPPYTGNKIDVDNMHDVRDIYVHENFVYVCGGHRLGNTTEGWIGRVRLTPAGDDFVNNTFEYYDINSVTYLHRLVAYTNSGTGRPNVVAIGHKNGTLWGEAYVVHLDVTFPTSPVNCVKFPQYNLQDITLTDNYAVVVGQDMNSNTYYNIMRLSKNSITFSVEEYTMPTPDFCYGHLIRCTATENDDIAVAHTTDYYTIQPAFAVAVKIIDIATLTNSKSFWYKVDEKIDPPELTYTAAIDRLVMLHISTLFPYVTSGSNFLYLDPYVPLVNPNKWVYDSSNSTYNGISNFGTRHFVAAGDNWCINNVTIGLPPMVCFVEDQYDVNIGQFTPINPSLPTSYSSINITPPNLGSSTPQAVNAICNY